MNRTYKILFAVILGVLLARPGFAQSGSAVQIGNKAFDSLNDALRVDAVATGGGGSSSAPFLNLDQLFGSVYDATHNALKVNVVSGLPCTADSDGAVTCTATGTNQNVTLAPSGTGASIVTNLEDKGGEVFNVKAYGAKGDGTTDDTAAINAAYAAATAVKGTVYFPCGTYLLTSAIADSEPVTWQGESQACATVEIPAGSAFDVFDVGSSNVSFKDLTIDANQNGANNNALAFTASVSNITLSDVTAENGGYFDFQTYPYAVSSLVVDDCTFTGGGAGDFMLEPASATASNITISHSTFGQFTAPANLNLTAAHVALYVHAETGSSIANLTIDNNQIFFPILTGTTEQESDGLVVSDSGGSATLTNVSVSSNNIRGTSGVASTNSHGIEFWGVDDATISGNTIGNSYNPVLVKAGAFGSYHGAITGNQINNPLGTTPAVIIEPSCLYTVSGNSIISAMGVQIAASYDVVTGNSIVVYNTASAQPWGIQAKCGETTCVGDIIADNNVNSWTGNYQNTFTGILVDVGSGTFLQLQVYGNTLDNLNFGLSFSNTTQTDTAIFRGNTMTGIAATTHHYNNLTSTNSVLYTTESFAPSGSCGNGGQWFDTAGAAGSTEYVCEAGAWVAK